MIADSFPGVAATPVGAQGRGNCASPVSQRSPGSSGQGSVAGAPHHPHGSMAVHELVMYTPKCRCGPLLQPGVPLVAITWPRRTACPGTTKICERCA